MQIRAVRTTIERVSETHLVHKGRRVLVKVSRSQWRAAVSIAVVLVTLTLTLLAVIAGSSPGFKEEYHILSLNTSTLGQNLIPTPISGGNNPSPTSCGPLSGTLGKLCAGATAAVGSAVSSGLAELSSIEDDIADKLSEEIGIQQWYSLHVMNICQGTFTPNATAPGAAYNVTSCTTSLVIIADTVLAALALLIGKVVVIRALSNLGQDIGLPLSTGQKFAAITWAAFGLMAMMALYWVYETLRDSRKSNKVN
ncbi:hypothetical protein GQ53DRAFT_868302 [Thozetella sp. PMI_491]|nr:hypothetical protein GQ53DRAFT_868302 [Thozetella sp. PMI_491]